MIMSGRGSIRLRWRRRLDDHRGAGAGLAGLARLASLAGLAGITSVALRTGLARRSGITLHTGLTGVAGIALGTRLALRTGGAGLGNRSGDSDDGGLAITRTQAQRCNQRK
jgi:hypothetical protein